MSSDLIDNILDGKLDTNAIKREWDKRKEEYCKKFFTEVTKTKK